MAKNGVTKASREQILAFRLQGQHLSTRLPAGKLVEAAGRVGIRNSPPGSAELAFHARVADFSVEKLDHALTKDKTLLEMWSVRSSPFFFPTSEAAIFAVGLLPVDEAGLRYVIKSVLPQLDLGEHTALEALDVIAEAATHALDHRQLTKGELSAVVSKSVPKGFLYWCKGCEAYHVPESLFRLAIQKANICFVPRNTSQDLLFARADQWLDKPLPAQDPARDRLEALRRYLACYGPSNSADFAAWAGLSPANGKQTWQQLADELAEIELEKGQSWLLKSDLKDFENPPTPQGVRLLPPYDPYLMATDRATLVPDKRFHGEFWRAIGNPGAILVDGEIVGTWRPQKKGSKLTLNLTLTGEIPTKNRDEIAAEAHALAPIKGASSVEVKYEDKV